MNINERMKRQPAIKRRMDILANQQEMYSALRDACQTLYFEDEVGRRGDALLVQLSREIIINCEQIWELSGQDRLAPDQGTTPAEGEADAADPF